MIRHLGMTVGLAFSGTGLWLMLAVGDSLAKCSVVALRSVCRLAVTEAGTFG